MFNERLSQAGSSRERFLPAGYTIDELRALSDEVLQSVCDATGFDIESVKENLSKATVVPSTTHFDSGVDKESHHRDELLLKTFLAEVSKSAVEVSYDLSEARTQVANIKKNDFSKKETLPQTEARMDGIVRLMKSTGDSPIYVSGVFGVYKAVFASLALEMFDTLIAEGKTTVEALTGARSVLKNKFENKPINSQWESAYTWAVDRFASVQKQNEIKIDFCDLIKRFLAKEATSDEVDRVNKILRAVKGLHSRGRDSTSSFPSKYSALKGELLECYQKTLQSTAPVGTTVTSADVFDANYHDLPDEIKNAVDTHIGLDE